MKSKLLKMMRERIVSVRFPDNPKNNYNRMEIKFYDYKNNLSEYHFSSQWRHNAEDLFSLMFKGPFFDFIMYRHHNNIEKRKRMTVKKKKSIKYIYPYPDPENDENL